MNIALSLEIENYLQSKVKNGFYNDVSEVIRDAIGRMKEQDSQLLALQAALCMGDEQIDKGEGIVYTPTRLEAITQQAFANAKRSKKVNADVTP